MSTRNKIVEATLQDLKNMEYVQERGGVGPWGLEQVGTIGNQKIYSSDKLKTAFIDVIGKAKNTKPVAESIEHMTNEGVIIPCYTTSGFIKFISHRLFGDDWDKAVMAFYSPETNRIYMLFDNRVSFLNFTNDEDLAATIIHELQHFACANLKMGFYSIFKDMFSRYYSTFFNGLYESVAFSTKNCDLITKFLLQKLEWAPDIKMNSFFETYEKILTKFNDEKKSEDPDWAHKCTDYYLGTLYMYFSDPNEFIRYISAQTGMPFYVFMMLIESYKKMGYKGIRNLCIQECVFPSEIAAVTSEIKPDARHYRVINMVANKAKSGKLKYADIKKVRSKMKSISNPYNVKLDKIG